MLLANGRKATKSLPFTEGGNEAEGNRWSFFAATNGKLPQRPMQSSWANEKWSLSLWSCYFKVLFGQNHAAQFLLNSSFEAVPWRKKPSLQHKAQFSFPSGVVAIAVTWIHNNQHLGCFSVFVPVQVVESLIDGLRLQQDILQAIELFHPFAKVFKGFRQSQMFILISFNLSLLCLLRAKRKFHRKLFSCILPLPWLYRTGHKGSFSPDRKGTSSLLHPSARPSGSCVRTRKPMRLALEEGSSLKMFWNHSRSRTSAANLLTRVESRL